MADDIRLQAVPEAEHDADAARDGSAGSDDPTGHLAPIVGILSVGSSKSSKSPRIGTDSGNSEIRYFSQKDKSRKDLRVATKSKKKVPQGSHNGKLRRTSDADKHQGLLSPLPSKANAALLASSDEEIILAPPKAFDPTNESHVPHHDLNAYHQDVTELINSKYQRRISVMAHEAIAKEEAHARTLQDRDEEIRILKQQLGSASTGSSDRSSLGITPKTRTPQAEPKQPIFYEDDEEQDEPDTKEIQYLYEGLSDRLRQAAAEMYILRAEMAECRADWLAMLYHANDALKNAEPLDYTPLKARCAFYRGIACFHLGTFWHASEDFEFARYSVDIYTTKEEIDAWVRAYNLAAKGAAPEAVQRPPAAPPRTPMTSISAQDSAKFWASGQAMQDELGSALASAALNSSIYLDSSGPSRRASTRSQASAHPAHGKMLERRATTAIAPSGSLLQSRPQKGQSLRQRMVAEKRPRVRTSLMELDAITEESD